MGVGDLFELLETLHVAFETFLTGAGACRGDGIGGLDQHVENAVGLDVGMMGLDGVDDFGLLAETAGRIGADHGMGAFDFMVDGLAEVVQQAGTLRRNRVRPSSAAMTPQR